jgi:DNA-binding protein
MNQNYVIIGDKPIGQYILAVYTLQNQGFSEIVIRGRGKKITKAVDLVELLKNKHMPGRIKVKDIKIGTDINSNGKGTSFIEITINID